VNSAKIASKNKTKPRAAELSVVRIQLPFGIQQPIGLFLMI
jgi:hypothetical protein